MTRAVSNVGPLLLERFKDAQPGDVTIDGADVYVGGSRVGDDPRDAQIVGGLVAAALSAVEDVRIEGARGVEA